MRSLIAPWAAAFALLAATLVSPAIAGACDKNFVVVNETDSSIVEFYVSPHSSDSWEENLLSSSNSIEPDVSKQINMESDTRELSLYDVKAVLDDGSKVEGGKINLCRTTKIHVYTDRVTYE